LFSITAEGGVAAGVRRVEAVTGDNALRYMQDMETALGGVAGTLKVLPKDVHSRVVAVLDQVRKLERELATLKGKLASAQGDDMLSQAVEVNGAKVLAANLEGADLATLRDTMDKLKDKLKSAAIVLASVVDGKVTLIAGVTADLTGKVKAGDLVNMVAQQVGGKGGGRPDMAQAGGTQPENLAVALASVQAWVSAKL
jgi:alanyl-tRNA synthetase